MSRCTRESVECYGVVARARISDAMLSGFKTSRVVNGFAFLLLLAVASTFATPAKADQIVRFGTGGSDGSYFPIGSLIAGQINASLDACCNDQTPLVLPQRSNGSVSNIRDISNGLLEMGLAQADVVRLAYRGMGQFEGEDLKDDLRTIATLFQESIHLVVSAESGISNIRDLSGKRVSVDELGSGTQFDAELILSAGGMSLEDIKPVYLKPTESMERMRRGQLDAIFVVSAFPVAGVKQLIEDGIGRVVALDEELVDRLVRERRYFSAQNIPPDVYSNTEEIKTLSVSAQMIVGAAVDADLVYEITRTLWSAPTLATLARDHAIGSDIVAEKALQGVVIPLHGGALRYYKQQGYDLSGVLE